jgi:hypothetical protein
VNLGGVLDQIDGLGDDEVIFAMRPWHMGCEATIDRLDAESRTPAHIAQQGFTYFLEVAVAREVLEVFVQRAVSDEKKRELVLFYAENDAYPGWAYDP